MYMYVYKHAGVGCPAIWNVQRVKRRHALLFRHGKAFRKTPNESFVKSAIDSAFLSVDEKISEARKKASMRVEWWRDSVANRSDRDAPDKVLVLFPPFFCRINRLNFHTRKADAVDSS